MPKSRAPLRPVVTPERVLRLFLSGRNTAEIASELQIREHDAYRLLRVSREAQRLLGDENRDTLPPVDEPPLEGF
jgi:hypothetical protein